MAFEVTVTGMAEVRRSLLALVEQLPARAAVGLNEVAEETMTDAKQHTPVKFGTLKRSGTVHKHATAADLTAALSFGTEYAVFVHERTELRHTVGEAKFLEHALQRAALTMAEKIAAAILRGRP